MSSGPELINSAAVFHTLNGVLCEAKSRVRISSFREHEGRNVASAQVYSSDSQSSCAQIVVDSAVQILWL